MFVSRVKGCINLNTALRKQLHRGHGAGNIMKTLTIAGGLQELAAMRRFVTEALEDAPVSPKEKADLKFCFMEAVLNAIKHGNAGDPAKEIRISVEIAEDSIFFRVEDRGDGFDINDIPDPTSPERLEHETGRGVFFMLKLMDEVKTEKTDFGFAVSLNKFID